jgi:hypothetical protein
MSDGPIPPFEAYQGEKPTIFISYAHRDAAEVYPEIHRLHQLGYHIWYDEGIDPGNEWPEEIAKALDACTLFLAFISERSANSINCRNEINYALNNKKLFLSVYLEKTELPGGLALRMGDLQAIMKYRMEPESYARKMDKALKSYLNGKAPDISDSKLQSSVSQITAPKQITDSKTESSKTESKKSSIVPVAIALLIILGGGLYLLQSPLETTTSKSESSPHIVAENEKNEIKPYAVAGLGVGKSKREILQILKAQESADTWSSKSIRYLLLSSTKSTAKDATLEAELLAAGLNLVEREKLKEIMKEQALSQSMLADPDTKLKLGKLMSARVFLEVTESHLKVFDSETSETFFMKALNDKELLPQLKASLKKRFPTKGKIISLGEDGQFYVNLGKRHSLSLGTKCVILRQGDPIKMGEKVLGYKKDKVGFAQATMVEDAYSVFTAEGDISLKVYDLLMAL